MKNSPQVIFVITIYLLLPFTTLCQEKISEISKNIKDYYSLERENIHVHFNKSTFLINESIWFKGYVYYRKKGTAFLTTTNIFAELKNSENKIISSKLLYGSMGSFEGNFEINPDLSSGTYYLQFYTNWMNNFNTDESAVYEIKIINPDKPPQNIDNEREVKINLYPEGGVFLKSKTNTMVVSVKGCDDKPLPVTKIFLKNNNEITQTISLDINGYGKFEYYALEDVATDSLNLVFRDKTYKRDLPVAQKKGITLRVVNKTGLNNTLLELKTNKETYPEIEDKPYYVLIHKDDNAFLFETKFADNVMDMQLILPNNYFQNGLNTIRILDNNLNEVAQRLVYKDYEDNPFFKIEKSGQEGGSILFTGQTNPNFNLSITVLPSQTKSMNNRNILNDFLLLPYLKRYGKTDTSVFFENTAESEEKLDKYLVSNKSKYSWQDIKKDPPKENNSFDIGLKIKGVINQELKKNKKYIVRLTSFDALIEQKTEIVNRNEFYFDNLILADSSKLNFELLENDKNIIPKLYIRVLNNSTRYKNSFIPQKQACYTDSIIADTDDLPDIEKETIALKEVIVKGKREELKYATTLGNGQLRGRKITEAESIGFPTVLDLIRYEGFEVRNRPDSAVAVYGRWKNTLIKGLKNSPDVFLDNFRLIKLDILRDILTSEIDEFYINKHMSVPTLQNRIGIIKIYLKKQRFNTTKDKPVFNHIVERGFERPKPFKNAIYTSAYNGMGFQNYGLIHWIPTILSDENGKFNFSIPLIYKGEVKVFIEGLSPDGKMISEVRTLSL